MMNERSKISNMKRMDKEILLAPKSERVEMTLNTANALTSGLLIQRLTELYENPIEATVRETVSNAIDAVSVNYSGERPVVKITAPSSLNPVLIVSDNGVGMSYEDLKEIYSKYGASTKADDFNQVGAYGLGAKAPLAYGTEFTVTSTKDGVKTSIIVAREELTNYIKIIDSVYTDENPGTTVSIPVNSSDLGSFINYVNSYASHPIDKDLDLYINGKLVNAEGFTLVDDSVVLFEGSEVVTGRLWVKSSEMSSMILNYDREDFKSLLGFVIGGWVYRSPKDSASSRSYRHYRTNEEIIIELKAGVVGFNSSRDSILNNDRYKDLEEKVLDYLLSTKFSKKMSEGVNKLEIGKFKNFLGNVLEKFGLVTSVENGELVINYSKMRYQVVEIDIDSFVHEETKYSLKKAMKDFCKDAKSEIFMEKTSYRKTPQYSCMSDNSRWNHGVKLGEINNRILNLMNSRVSLSEFVLKEILQTEYSKELPRSSNIFITDIVDEDSVRKFKTKRKAITDAIKTSGYSSFKYILTTATKKSVEKMLKTAEIERTQCKVISFEEALKETKKAKENKPKVEKKVVKKEPLIRIYKHMGRNAKPEIVTEVDTTKKNVILADRYLADSFTIERFVNWYANKNNLKKSEFEVYIAPGYMNPESVKYVISLGEVFRNPHSERLGKSELYYNTIAKTRAGFDYLYSVEKEKTDIQYIFNIIVGTMRISHGTLYYRLHELIKEAKNSALALGVDFSYEEETSSLIEALNGERKEWTGVFDRDEYNAINEDSVAKMVDMISPESKAILNETLLMINSQRIINFDRKDKYESVLLYSSGIDLEFDSRRLVQEKEKYGDSRFVKLKEKQLKENVEFVKEILESLEKIAKTA